MGLFSSNKYQDQLIAELKARIATLENQLEAARIENSRLVERLLLKNAVPLASDKVDTAKLARALETANIFEEPDDPEPIEDNRKDKLDAFVTG